MFKLYVICVCFFILWNVNKSEQSMWEQVAKCVKEWSKKLGNELYNLSTTMTRKRKIEKSFSQIVDKIHYESEMKLLIHITDKMKRTMEKKIQAVERIAQYAEFLAYHRKTDYIEPNGTFYFYNADNITNTTCDCGKEKELEKEIQEAKCVWWCEQKDLPVTKPLKHNYFTKRRIEELFAPACDCSTIDRTRPQENFNLLPLKKHPNYGDTPVNLNLSVVKIATNIYEREQEVLQGVRWSEPLDMVFKENLDKDPTLKYQYFASPHGYMRHYPAVKWSDERYDQTYDPRTRSWYTEAMTSPKDVFILLDSSGSVCKLKRKIAAHIVNNILDTLNDNDFVNIYLFANSTRPLVPCFKDTLVQANEENLRLLRETLDNYNPDFQANIAVGLEKAFTLLAEFREKGIGSLCNQAIMLITEEAFFREDEQEFFNRSNWQYGTPVRVFTYQLERSESDARLLEWIACSNKGYFVNISLMQEVREKALPYLNVMSRPINYCHKDNPPRGELIWSYLYIDLADRRYTNWLWRKLEGNRQRAIFLDHAKRDFTRLQKVLTSESHFLLQDNHDYEKYEKPNEYDYMTTLSLPVYSRRSEDVDLIGVAGIDIPIKLLNSLIPHHTIGVNGYAFIVTNNGYILMHPGHRREFENIPKPTFNRVDLLEVEILDDTNEPRIFDKSIVKLRDKIVQQVTGSDILKVKYALDNMKRIVLSKRRYVFMALGSAFSVGIALPDKYGLMVANITIKNIANYKGGLLQTKNWAVHPDWVYCGDNSGKEPEEVVKNCLLLCIQKRDMENKNVNCEEPLFKSLLFDAEVTKWFDEPIPNEAHFTKQYLVDNVFMATHSGLTRWKSLQPQTFEEVVDDDEGKGKKEVFWGNRSIDEDWYKRAVQENFNRNEDHFIYSVPFEISGYEYNTMITSINAIFVTAEGKKSPVAAVGVQFNHRRMLDVFNQTTAKCDSAQKPFQCACKDLSCYILDNNAYVVLSNEKEYTGRFVGDVSPIITHRLIQNGVYKRIRMFDYQAICQKPPESKTKNSATMTITLFRRLLENLLNVTDWALATILMLIASVTGGPDYESTKNETLLYERLEINKTVPTPCDKQMWLFTLGDKFNSVDYSNKSSKAGCDWYYVIERIPHSNLLFMAANPVCELDTVSHFQSHSKTPTPVEIDYNDNETLACYIAKYNNFTRRFYTKCYNYSSDEDKLAGNRTYCGHTWKP
ncbi:voltage-dependent calcium channel subunit alpha-2/delta-3-like [Tribolium madens]|uniref:voltage-dependent calcium channel subunit alpha-2/delta-3-like n=1 Tax=Tribolium madens TaxID=41895 RepID=UPI001CF7480E|nr:voltage-dependent calcium channel subunit alpha-2/delta-3-like [Tribolium madens]